MVKPISTLGKYMILMGRVFSRPERVRMYFKQYVNEMAQLGINSIGIVLLISFFIGAVICIQIKLNIESPWMPRFVVGYTTREILLLEFSSSIMCLILAGKVGSNIASELGTMRVTQQIDALEIMGVNSASYDTYLSDIQYLCRCYRCILYRMVCRNHERDRFRIRYPVLFRGMVRMVQFHQIALLRLYHFQRIGILRLYGRRRFDCGG